MRLVDQAGPAAVAVANALGEDITPENARELTDRALAAGVLTEEQAGQVRAAQERNPTDLDALYRQGQTWVVE